MRMSQLAYPIDDSDWFTRITIACRLCPQTRTVYIGQVLPRLPFARPYLADIAKAARCSRTECKGSQRLALPDNPLPDEAPLAHRIGYAMEQARRGAWYDVSLLFDWCLYRDLVALYGLPCAPQRPNTGNTRIQGQPLPYYEGLPIEIRGTGESGSCLNGHTVKGLVSVAL